MAMRGQRERGFPWDVMGGAGVDGREILDLEVHQSISQLQKEFRLRMDGNLGTFFTVTEPHRLFVVHAVLCSNSRPRNAIESLHPTSPRDSDMLCCNYSIRAQLQAMISCTPQATRPDQTSPPI